MGDSSPRRSSRHVNRSKPPAWALAEIRDDSKDDLGRQTPSGTAPVIAANGSALQGVTSKPSKMTHPSQFTFKKELGSGSWSTVMEATHVATGKLYAVKILSKAQLIKLKKVKYATAEKDALVKLSGTHPGIVRMHAAFQDDTSLYFVLDLAPHGDLADLVKKHGSLSLRCARWYTAQIVDAVLWVHRMGMVHRDLKPENMLLDSELRIKLTDFGSVYVSPDGDLSPRASTFVGSAAYVSPELLNRASKTTSSSSDIWAIGCSTYFMIAGTPAFAAINDYQSFRKIEALDYTFPEGFYDIAKDFVQKLVVLDPADRLGVEPKSSPSELRGHQLFTGLAYSTTPEESDGTPVRWDTLWTDPPVPPETGIIGPAPTAVIPEAEDDSLWDNVVHEFSLVDVKSARANANVNGGPFSPSDLLMPTAGPVDVPPGAVPTEVVETVAVGNARRSEHDGVADGEGNAAAKYTVDGHARAVAAVNDGDPARGDLGHVADSILMEKDWSSFLASGETVRRVASVRTPIRRGLSKQPRSCALLLTSVPRVLCIVLEDIDKWSKKPEAKQSFIFAMRSGNKLPVKGEKVLGKCRMEREQRKLVLQTDEKEFVYDFSDDKALTTWAQELIVLLENQ